MFLPEAQRDERKVANAAERFKKPLAVLDGALAGRPYLLGDTFSVADLNVCSVVSLTSMVGFDLGSAPNVQAWLGRCLARPALVRAQSA